MKPTSSARVFTAGDTGECKADRHMNNVYLIFDIVHYDDPIQVFAFPSVASAQYHFRVSPAFRIAVKQMAVFL